MTIRERAEKAYRELFNGRRAEYDDYIDSLERAIDAAVADEREANNQRVPLWRELEALVRGAVNSHLPTCPCMRCGVLRKLSALDDRGHAMSREAVLAKQCRDCGKVGVDMVSRWRRFSAGISGNASVCADRKACAERVKIERKERNEE